MSDPKRLLDEETGLGQRLLLEARTVPPPPKHLLRRTLAAVSAAGGLAPAASAASGLASEASVLAPAGASLAKSGVLIIGKWAVGGLAMGALVTSGGMLLRQPPERSVPSAVSLAGQPMVVPAHEAPNSPQARPSAPPAMAPTTRPATPPASNPGHLPLRRLGEEARSLDEASAALARGDPELALHLLDRHGREFPNGQLAPEAALVRLQALKLKGDHAAADTLARQLSSHQPNSRYADRVREIVGQERDQSAE